MLTAHIPHIDFIHCVVVFPSVGYQDIPNGCSGGDLDGDDFRYVFKLYINN